MLYEIRPKSPFALEHEVSFLTFNYDVALDYALAVARMPYDYGLSRDPAPQELPLIKLHGSINWGVCQECNQIVPIELDERILYSYPDGDLYYFILSPALPKTQHCGKPLGQTPMLIPPTWNKTGYHENLAAVWEKAARELAAAENIFIIGYSLPETDSFFRYLYALGSESSTRIKRFWVFNPDSEVEPSYPTVV
jgi:NAD-dependent SIR2 family protein deacetylase